jgi:NAD(P)-dependent dehydrogenase (short-subunit alcohol dehydrogenase family)
MSLDLGTMAKVRDFGSRWEAAKHPPIRALVLNAGIQLPNDAEYSNDGVERHMAINHVGHALLFHLLVPHLTPNARIVVVASGVHDPDSTWPIKPAYTTAEQVVHPSKEEEKKLNGRTRYATSKVANIIWTNALARRLEKEGKGKTVVSEDPGLVPATGKSYFS